MALAQDAAAAVQGVLVQVADTAPVIAGRAAFGLAIALIRVHSPWVCPAATVAAAEDDWGEAELEPGRV